MTEVQDRSTPAATPAPSGLGPIGDDGLPEVDLGACEAINASEPFPAGTVVDDIGLPEPLFDCVEKRSCRRYVSRRTARWSLSRSSNKLCVANQSHNMGSRAAFFFLLGILAVSVSAGVVARPLSVHAKKTIGDADASLTTVLGKSGIEKTDIPTVVGNVVANGTFVCRAHLLCIVSLCRDALANITRK